MFARLMDPILPCRHQSVPYQRSTIPFLHQREAAHPSRILFSIPVMKPRQLNSHYLVRRNRSRPSASSTFMSSPGLLICSSKLHRHALKIIRWSCHSRLELESCTAGILGHGSRCAATKLLLIEQPNDHTIVIGRDTYNQQSLNSLFAIMRSGLSSHRELQLGHCKQRHLLLDLFERPRLLLNLRDRSFQESTPRPIPPRAELRHLAARTRTSMPCPITAHL